MKLENLISVSLIVPFNLFCAFYVNPNAFFKFTIVVFFCKWGAQLTIQICHPTAIVYWDPNLPSWKMEGKRVQEQILHITYPSSLMHVFIAIASLLCHLKGQPPKLTPKYFVSAFSAVQVSLLWLVLYKTVIDPMSWFAR